MRMKMNHFYKINDRGQSVIAQYIGKEHDFECCVCGKGNNATCFNIWYDKNGGYETWGFGREHMPEIIEEVGSGEEVILSK